MTHYPKFFLNKGRILALWVMYTIKKQFIVQIIGILEEIDSYYCTYEEVTTNLGRALPPPSFGQHPKEQQFFLVRSSLTTVGKE